MTSSNQRYANDIPTDWNWVDPQVLATKSIIRSLNNTAKLVRPNIDPRTVSFSPCTDSDRVCFSRVAKAGGEFFYVYASLFTDLGLRLPLSAFQLQILNAVDAAPTQLHPIAWVLVVSFELLCQSCALVPTVSTFFFFFQLASPYNNMGKMSWVHIHERPGPRKILTSHNLTYNFKNCFFRVEGREDAVPFFMDENRKPKFPLHWSKLIKSPGPYSTFLSDCDRTLIYKLQKLKEPIHCYNLIRRYHKLLSCSFFVPSLDVSPDSESHTNANLNDKSREEEEKEEEVVEVSASAVMKTKRKRIVDVENMEHLRCFEGEGSIASLWDSRFDFDHHVRNHLFFHTDEDKLRRTGHVDVGHFMKANALRIAAGAEFLVEEAEMTRKEVSRLTSELEKERNARMKAEGQLEEEKVGHEKAERELARCEGELARARKESEYTEGCLLREWKKSVAVSFQNAIDQVRLGFPHLNLDSIVLDPFKVVEGEQLVDPPSAGR